MTYDDNIREFLRLIDNEEFDPERCLPHLSREELKKVVLMSEEDGYISHRSSQGKPLIQNFMGGGWMISPETFVTRSGKQFMEGVDRKINHPTQIFYVQSAYNSAIGNENIINNNYSDTPIEDLKKYIKNSIEKKDKETGQKIVETLENDDIKPGLLAKFEKFFKKYPRTIDFVASFVTSVVISKFP